MKGLRLALIAFLFVTAGGAARAEGFCNVTDLGRLLGLAGVWQGDPRLSLESLDTSRLRSAPPRQVRIDAIDGTLTIDDTFIDSITGARLALALSQEAVYDVDHVDDLLDATEHENLADVLSDTRCGPENLPQLVAVVATGEGIVVTGTVTLIAYFSDRLLMLTELTLKSDDALFYMTETMLLRPMRER